MKAPAYKKPPVHVRFTAADCAEWMVWGVTRSYKKHHRRPHGDPTATERVFVNAQGVKRAYKLKPSDSRVLEAHALQRQLHSATFLPTTKENKDGYSLSEAQRRTPTFSDGPGRQ